MADADEELSFARPLAVVSFGDLVPEILLLCAAAVFVFGSAVLELCGFQFELFQRSGAIAVLLAAIVAFRSLSKHYRKFLNYTHLKDVPKISKNQRIIDRWTLFISAVGTIIWAYGDLIL